MTLTAETPRWHAIGLVIDLNTKDHRAGRYGLVHDLVSWFKAIRLFRDAEDERMILQKPTSGDLRQHRTWLAGLIAEGERLLTESVEAGGLPEGSVRFRLKDVEAAIQNLRTDERMWHGALPIADRQEILKTAFNVQES